MRAPGCCLTLDVLPPRSLSSIFVVAPSQDAKVRAHLDNLLKVPGVMRDSDGNERKDLADMLGRVQLMLER